MGDSSAQYTKLPPGWDCKYDQATGNCYYINYFTKAMQLEDPRMRYKPLQNEKCSTESIAMAPLHGSPYHVYPSNNYPAVRAFQGPANNQSLQNMSSSPLLSSHSNLEMSPLPLPKSLAPQTPHQLNMSRRSTIQETSFTNQIDTDAVVSNIQNMFPTAGENHIRLLLKRYMKTIFPKADETLLLDILANADNNVQIASEKLISLGYIKRDFVAPKPSNRPELDAEGRPKKPSDVKIIPLRPKEYSEEEKEAMKKRLKAKYPNIAERIILMALESVSYAEDRAIQILQIVQDEDETRERKTTEMLQKVEQQAGETLTDGIGTSENTGGTDNLITIVLETTNAASAGKHHVPSINVTTPSTKTTQIILSHSPNEPPNQCLNEQQEQTKTKTATITAKASPIITSSASQSFQSFSTKSILARSNSNETGSNGYLLKAGASSTILEELKSSRSRDKTHSLKYTARGCTEENPNLLQQQEFKSILGRLATVGHNDDLAKGPDDTLLLADYVTWNGANPTISVGHKQIATGPDSALLSERSYTAVGRNADLCKGAKVGLAKGSIYAQLAAGGANSANIKCN